MVSSRFSNVTISINDEKVATATEFGFWDLNKVRGVNLIDATVLTRDLIGLAKLQQDMQYVRCVTWMFGEAEAFDGILAAVNIVNDETIGYLEVVGEALTGEIMQVKVKFRV